MSAKETVDKVARVLALHVMRPEEVALQLNDAGLLCPSNLALMERALALCEKCERIRFTGSVTVVLDEGAEIGRESFALKATAKRIANRWIAHRPAFSDTWLVGHESTAPFPLFARLTEAQATALAKTLNDTEVQP